MQKVYLNKVNDVAAIELALIARESELRAVLGRVKDASSNGVRICYENHARV